MTDTADLTPSWTGVLQLFLQLGNRQFGPVDAVCITAEGDIYVLPNKDDGIAYIFDPEDDTMADGTPVHYDFVSTNRTWEQVTARSNTIATR
jgi:hypothetical protein